MIDGFENDKLKFRG